MKIGYNKKTKQYVAKIPLLERRQAILLEKYRWKRVGQKEGITYFTTTDIHKILELEEHCVGSAKRRITDYKNKTNYAIQDSLKEDTDYRAPTPEGLDLFPFQHAGVEYALDRKHVLIADPCGLGKTVQAIAVSNLIQNRNRRLIICPASLKRNWSKEFQKWDTNDLTVGEVYSKNWVDTDVVIINPDILTNHIDNLKSCVWELVIMDESQMFTNFEAMRTELALGEDTIIAKKHVALSATPLRCRPRELWPICKKFDPEGLGRDEEEFYLRYCSAYYDGFGMNNLGSSNADELQQKMRSTFMVRRPKAVLKLPPKTSQIITLPSNGLENKIKAETEAFNEYKMAYLETIGMTTELYPMNDEDALIPEPLTEDINYNQQVEALSKPEITHTLYTLSTARKELAIAKSSMVIEFTKNIIKSRGKTILFCHHKEVATRLKEAFPDAGLITGDIKVKDRQEVVEKFQTDDSMDLIIGTIGAMGEGHTLTASNTVIFAELGSTPAQMTQAEDRPWRFGQENEVWIYHLVVDNSEDSRVVLSLTRNQRVVDNTLDSPEYI